MDMGGLKSVRHLRWPGLLLLAIVTLWPAHAAQAKGCAGDWDYSESSLQNARRRLKSPAHPNALSRVQCGTDLTAALELAEWPTDCPRCRREYIGLMNDLIEYTRRAAEVAKAHKNKMELYRREVETRTTLGDFLLATRDADLIKTYWSKNFDGMGDAMERGGFGKSFHERAQALPQRDQVYSEKTFQTWARDIRSCPVWDFRAGQNKDFPALRRTLMCSEECRRALERIRQRASSGQAEDKVAMGEVLDDLLPAVEDCPTGANK